MMVIFVVVVVADAVVDVDAGVNSVNIFKCIVRILLMILYSQCVGYIVIIKVI